MPDHIVQKSISLQPLFVDGRSRGLRMNKNQRLQFLGLGPERMELRRGEIVAIHAATDSEAAHSQILHAVFHLLRGERRILQRNGAQARETQRMRGAEFRNFLILNLNDFAREIHVRPIPKGIDRDGLHINSHFV